MKKKFKLFNRPNFNAFNEFKRWRWDKLYDADERDEFFRRLENLKLKHDLQRASPFDFYRLIIIFFSSFIIFILLFYFYFTILLFFFKYTILFSFYVNLLFYFILILFSYCFYIIEPFYFFIIFFIVYIYNLYNTCINYKQYVSKNLRRLRRDVYDTVMKSVPDDIYNFIEYYYITYIYNYYFILFYKISLFYGFLKFKLSSIMVFINKNILLYYDFLESLWPFLSTINLNFIYNQNVFLDIWMYFNYYVIIISYNLKWFIIYLSFINKSVRFLDFIDVFPIFILELNYLVFLCLDTFMYYIFILLDYSIFFQFSYILYFYYYLISLIFTIIFNSIIFIYWFNNISVALQFIDLNINIQFIFLIDLVVSFINFILLIIHILINSVLLNLMIFFDFMFIFILNLFDFNFFYTNFIYTFHELLCRYFLLYIDLYLSCWNISLFDNMLNILLPINLISFCCNELVFVYLHSYYVYILLIQALISILLLNVLLPNPYKKKNTNLKEKNKFLFEKKLRLARFNINYIYDIENLSLWSWTTLFSNIYAFESKNIRRINLFKQLNLYNKFNNFHLIELLYQFKDNSLLNLDLKNIAYEHLLLNLYKDFVLHDSDILDHFHDYEEFLINDSLKFYHYEFYLEDRNPCLTNSILELLSTKSFDSYINFLKDKRVFNINDLSFFWDSHRILWVNFSTFRDYLLNPLLIKKMDESLDVKFLIFSEYKFLDGTHIDLFCREWHNINFKNASLYSVEPFLTFLGSINYSINLLNAEYFTLFEYFKCWKIFNYNFSILNIYNKPYFFNYHLYLKKKKKKIFLFNLNDLNNLNNFVYKDSATYLFSFYLFFFNLFKNGLFSTFLYPFLSSNIFNYHIGFSFRFRLYFETLYWYYRYLKNIRWLRNTFGKNHLSIMRNIDFFFCGKYALFFNLFRFFKYIINIFIFIFNLFIYIYIYLLSIFYKYILKRLFSFFFSILCFIIYLIGYLCNYKTLKNIIKHNIIFFKYMHYIFFKKYVMHIFKKYNIMFYNILKCFIIDFLYYCFIKLPLLCFILLIYLLIFLIIFIFKFHFYWYWLLYNIFWTSKNLREQIILYYRRWHTIFLLPSFFLRKYDFLLWDSLYNPFGSSYIYDRWEDFIFNLTLPAFHLEHFEMIINSVYLNVFSKPLPLGLRPHAFLNYNTKAKNQFNWLFYYLLGSVYLDASNNFTFKNIFVKLFRDLKFVLNIPYLFIKLSILFLYYLYYLIKSNFKLLFKAIFRLRNIFIFILFILFIILLPCFYIIYTILYMLLSSKFINLLHKNLIYKCINFFIYCAKKKIYKKKIHK